MFKQAHYLVVAECSPSSLESWTHSHACRPLSKHISIPLTKECLNCIICQAGRLAKAYSPAPCLCPRLNRAAAFENVTHSCGALLPSEHTCIFWIKCVYPIGLPQVEVHDLPCCKEVPRHAGCCGGLDEQKQTGINRAKSHYLSS